jgi:hypothetical protein
VLLATHRAHRGLFGALVAVPLLVIYLSRWNSSPLGSRLEPWCCAPSAPTCVREQARRTEVRWRPAAKRGYAALDGRAAGADRLGPNEVTCQRRCTEPLIDPQIPREMLMQVRGNRPYMA